MRYVIYGAGGIGGAIGARLFQKGREVILICRGAHLAKVQADGLTLQAPGEAATLRIPAVGSPAEITFRHDDVALLTMKSQDTAAALNDLRAAAPGVPVVCAQNGVANERMALRRFSRVYGMVVVLPAVHLEPGLVLTHATGIGGVLDAGCYPTGIDSLIGQVTADLSDAGFASRPDPAIMRLKYAKLLQNIGNVVQALCGPEAAAGDIIREIRPEALACYEAAGIDCADVTELRERSAGITLGQIDGQTRWGGSTWQSLARGSGSIETDFLNGEIALLGALHGIPTPYNRLLQRLGAQAAREGWPPGKCTVEQLLEMGRSAEGVAKS